MLDLDAAEKVDDYKVKFRGKEYTFETLEIVDALTQNVKEMASPSAIRDKMRKIFGLEFSTCEAMIVLRDFETFADNFEMQVKNLFGHQPSSPTTTESAPTTQESSVEEHAQV